MDGQGVGGGQEDQVGREREEGISEGICGGTAKTKCCSRGHTET